MSEIRDAREFVRFQLRAIEKLSDSLPYAYQINCLALGLRNLKSRIEDDASKQAEWELKNTKNVSRETIHEKAIEILKWVIHESFHSLTDKPNYDEQIKQLVDIFTDFGLIDRKDYFTIALYELQHSSKEFQENPAIQMYILECKSALQWINEFEENVSRETK